MLYHFVQHVGGSNAHLGRSPLNLRWKGLISSLYLMTWQEKCGHTFDSWKWWYTFASRWWRRRRKEKECQLLWHTQSSNGKPTRPWSLSQRSSTNGRAPVSESLPGRSWRARQLTKGSFSGPSKRRWMIWLAVCIFRIPKFANQLVEREG